MSTNVIDGLLEVLSDENLGTKHIILVDEKRKHYKITNINIKDTLENKDAKMLFINIQEIS